MCFEHSIESRNDGHPAIAPHADDADCPSLSTDFLKVSAENLPFPARDKDGEKT